MKKTLFLLMLVCFITSAAFAQPDSALNTRMLPVFERITQEMKNFKPDTTAAPNDRITKKIMELRKLKGGFNINEAIDFKLAEDKQKKDISAEEFTRLSYFFQSGNGRKWLDNAVIWIYRQHFNYKELKQVVKFYKTSGGQKMAGDFPIVMLKTLAAGEMIKNFNASKQQSK